MRLRQSNGIIWYCTGWVY